MKFFKFWLWIAGLFCGIAVGGMVLPYILAGDIYEYQDSVDGVHLPEVDAIVVLAGGRGRLAAAGDVWYRYKAFEETPKAPVLYISGMGSKSNWSVFARQLRTGVREIIRPENVVLETESTNTEENARFLARYATQRGWKRILLMTSPYHMKRAQLIFDRTFKAAGVQIQVDTLSIFQEPFEPNEWRSSAHGVHVTLSEYLKWVHYKYFWRGERLGPVILKQ